MILKLDGDVTFSATSGRLSAAQCITPYKQMLPSNIADSSSVRLTVRLKLSENSFDLILLRKVQRNQSKFMRS